MPTPLTPIKPAPINRPSLPACGVMALFLLLIAACAPLQTAPNTATQTPPPSWPAHRAAMQAIDSWQLKGKLAYRSDAESGSAWFDWRQHGDKFTIYLSGPFGVGTVQISGNAQAITLSQPGEADIHSHSSSALTQRLFGWQLPVEQMRSWIRGIAASSSSRVIKTFNEADLLDSLQEDNWQLTISRYQTGPYGQLPGKIKGRSDKLAFTLLLKEWSFPEHGPQHGISNPSALNPNHSPDK